MLIFFISELNQTMFVEKNVQRYYRGWIQWLGEEVFVDRKMSLEMESTFTSFGSIGNSTVSFQ